MTELEKYEGIYGSASYSSYGHTNHGRGSLAIWDSWRVRSIVDVGCGHNEFLRSVREWPRPWGSLVGVDFACPSADVRATATALPFFDGQFDLVTSFDCLEHLRPEEVDRALREMRRVSRAFVVSIAYQRSRVTWQGENLHPTVRPEAWWIDRLVSAGAEVRKCGRFLYGCWPGRDVTDQGFPVEEGKRVVLVGNGPSVLKGSQGAEIDAHDEVVRFNAFKVAGFEEHTGHRTTLWATYGLGMVPQDGVRPQRMIIRGNARPAYEPSELWRIPLALFRRLGDELTATAGREVMPSSGLLVLAWLLDEGGVGQVTLAGFDHFSKAASGQHHYWLKQSFSRPKEHDGDAEADMVAKWAAAGRVRYLCKALAGATQAG